MSETKKVRELLTDESKWCKGATARDAGGKKLWFQGDRHAVSWCLHGAIGFCYPLNEAVRLEKKLEADLGQRGSAWNDAPERVFADVKALVDELDI